MSKEESRNTPFGRAGRAPAAAQIGRPHSSRDLEWDSIDVEFFAREAELYSADPSESWDDLENG